MRRILEDCKSENGQTLPFVAIGLALIIGMVGLAVDAGQLYAMKQRAQTAADAGAQAGVMDMLRGTALSAATCATSGGIAPCGYVRLNGFKTPSHPNDVVTVAFPLCSSYSWCTTNIGTLSSSTLIHVTVSRPDVPTTLLRALGAFVPAASTVTAEAFAAITSSPSAAPIVITHPHLKDALSITDAAAIITICGGPARSIEVNSDGTVDGNNNAVVPAEAYSVHSGATVDLSKAGPADGGNCTTGTGADFVTVGPGPTGIAISSWLTPMGATEHYVQPASPIADPLASLCEPGDAGCALTVPAGLPQTPTLVANGVLLGVPGCIAKCPDNKGCDVYKPGHYAAGIVGRARTAYFYPGLYYLDSGDNNGFQATAKNDDMEMMFSVCPGVALGDADFNVGMVVFNAGTGNFNVKNATINLTGALPASPNYRSILFWNKRGLPTAGILDHSFLAGGNLILHGTIYANNSTPTYNKYQRITLHGNPSSNTQITGEVITNVLLMGGNAGITMNLSKALEPNQKQVALVK